MACRIALNPDPQMYLLDTCAFLWIAMDQDQFSPPQQQAVLDSGANLFTHPFRLWKSPGCKYMDTPESPPMPFVGSPMVGKKIGSRKPR
jgi:hypothetical protein